MRDFVIVSDSCCEMYENKRKQFGVDYLPMYLAFDDKEARTSIDWEDISEKEYYGILRKGTRIFTSQVPSIDYKNCFEKYVKQGYDILSISTSSGLSASVKASYVARDEVLEQYPEAKIVCVDSLICSFGLYILCRYASNLKRGGKTIEAVATAVEELKMNVNQIGTVDDLNILKMAGRVSASAAFFGSLLKIKPIIISNEKGENVSVEKLNGRVKSLRRLAELIASRYTGKVDDEIFIAHADCEEDAKIVKEFTLEQKPHAKVTVRHIGPIVGGSCGPGMIGAYFVGETRETYDKQKEE